MDETGRILSEAHGFVSLIKLPIKQDTWWLPLIWHYNLLLVEGGMIAATLVSQTAEMSSYILFH